MLMPGWGVIECALPGKSARCPFGSVASFSSSQRRPRPSGVRVRANDVMRQTTFATKDSVEQEWLHFDAQGLVLGRLASRIAVILQGKHKPTWTPHVDTGDFVVVTNAAGIVISGNKAETKVYRHHTGYIGSLKERPYAQLMERDPSEVIELAVKRMLPKSKLGRKMFKKLKVYAGAEHPHDAQSPKTVSL